MNTEDDAPPCGVSRRDLFRTAGAGAVAAAVGGPLGAGVSAAQTPPPIVLELMALESLNVTEGDILEAVCARLIPSDENGPGAAEARAARYIDRALDGPLHNFREAYAAGLAAIDDHARAKHGVPFVKLAPQDQDAVLADVESNAVMGFPGAAVFFKLVMSHTIQGTFCDPYWGGNANFIGWDMVGYPGLRVAVRPEDQRLAKPSAVRRSAYEDAMFSHNDSTSMKGGGHDH